MTSEASASYLSPVSNCKTVDFSTNQPNSYDLLILFIYINLSQSKYKKWKINDQP